MSRFLRVTALTLGMGMALTSPPAGAHPEHRKYKKLVRHGVKIAVLAQNVRFRGLVKGGAPLVVDFELEADGRLELEIKTRNVRHRETLEFPARAGARKLAVQPLPAGFDQAWQTGRLTVSAVDDSGRQIDFRLFGVGVGDRAVGSTGIYQVTFEPAVIRGAEPASWGFRARHDFERSGIVVYRWQGDAGYWRQSRSFDAECPPRRGERCQGAWDGRDGDGERSKGPHLLAVKAWQSDGEKDWVFALSEGEVAVE